MFLHSASVMTAAWAASRVRMPLTVAASVLPAPLNEFNYGSVTVTSELHRKQFDNTHAVLMGLSEDSLLKPFRQMVGQPAPGEELGGWYKYDPNYDWHTFDAGFAPSATFGQWISALARAYAINQDAAVREKILRLNLLYAKTISGEFYSLKNRFPAYCYDKLVCGLIDSHQWAGDSNAYRILEQTTDTAIPYLPGKAIKHGQSWRPGTDVSYTWDESHTVPENMFLAYQRGAGERYLKMGKAYLDDEYFDPLAEGHCPFEGRHAYSHVNALCSAMQAYLTLGSRRHLLAASNGFDFLQAQSYSTGGWGPDETLRAPNSDDVEASLQNTHHSFETPCGAYAHFKLTRYLLRVTGNSQYGDSMEQVMYNTILGALPLQPDGRTFYYSDYNFKAQKVYCEHRWPCCSGTMPQIATDYWISSYFHDRDGVYVNLYMPSSLRWTQDGTQVSISQETSYPTDSQIRIDVSPSRQLDFALRLRIPSWANGASVSVNGKRMSAVVRPGQFFTIQRTWKGTDHVELELPLRMRLEPIDSRHPRTVALLAGPTVLFAIADKLPQVSGQELLSAKSTGNSEWIVQTDNTSFRLRPFTAISDQQYSTYLMVK
ncbi:MAG TPA: beta-L-arabinofuranosidase domain-containing protein [Terriglobales bacterium]|jgi:hypothetical protein